MIRRAIISGGGTGGHIFPALAIAKALQRENPGCEILFVGAVGRMEMQRVPQAGYPIEGLEVEGLDRKRPWRNFGVIKKYLLAIVKARDIIKAFQPDIVIGVGGYVSAPTLKAAQTLGIPTMIQEQNSYAGKANKRIARRAEKICVAYPDMERFFPKDKIVLTGNPIRPEIEFMQEDLRAETLRYFGFSERVSRVVLVVGGSLGARTINESIGSTLEAWQSSGVALIWQTGKSYIEEARALTMGYQGEIYVSDFIDRMDLAYSLSDVVISRAGASSISELEVLGKPAILVPSPNVAEDHQTKNALALVQRNAALLVTDREARQLLSRRALELVENKEERRVLSQEISRLAHRAAGQKIAQIASEIVSSHTK